MRKIIFITAITIILLGFTPKSSWAFDRSAARQGARVISNSNFTYNVNTVVLNVALNSGPVIVGSNDRSLPAYGQIAQITAQIQALKLQLKNFSPK